MSPPILLMFPYSLKKDISGYPLFPVSIKWSWSLVRQNPCEALKNETNASLAHLKVQSWIS